MSLLLGRLRNNLQSLFVYSCFYLWFVGENAYLDRNFMDIEVWLRKFKECWESHDVQGVLDLFDRDVIYYETPFLRLKDFKEIEREWRAIQSQKDIVLTYEVFSQNGKDYAVIWKLRYINPENEEKNYSGTYLMRLNDEGLCTFFHHTCEASDNEGGGE